jgi:hypothetical protein
MEIVEDQRHHIQPVEMTLMPQGCIPCFLRQIHRLDRNLVASTYDDPVTRQFSSILEN